MSKQIEILDRFSFDVDEWINLFKILGYPITIFELDLNTLIDIKAIPNRYKDEIRTIKRFYYDNYIECVIIDTNNISRSKCVEIAKRWKENRWVRPFLIFTNKRQKEAFLIVVPGKGLQTDKVRTLYISDRFYHTDKEVISLLHYSENLKDRYDEEFLPYDKVREEFFNDYRRLYEEIVNKTKYLESINSDFNSSSYAQRFLGRLMFIYFLQRKGWLANDKNFINTIKDYRELNEIFYNKLSNEDTDLIFLNGSLFEKEPYIDQLEDRLADVMDDIFKEARDTFNKYNFTVDESTPLEKEVSLDPLLLGTVLENMLPEQERGAKGTFYTPVEEIAFMCRRAIANYLRLKDSVNSNFTDGIDEYIARIGKESDIGKKERIVREVKERLLNLKILDPAVGSGGFLVIMMQTIIEIIHKLEHIVGWHTDPYELKKRIIPNLYGFDIEPEAVEIARLRLWLSLIVDQKYPTPLPNLDYNIEVITDSLTKPTGMQLKMLFNETEYGDIYRLRERFDELLTRYINEHRYSKKREVREEMSKIQEQINKQVKLAGIDVIEKYILKTIDIIVMNPPYVRQEAIPKDKKERYVKDYKLDKKSDLYCYFMLRALDLIKDDGIVCTITSDKWLESSYGISLQKRLKDHIIAIYGQKDRSFKADINTIITVYSKEKRSDPIEFVYIESYSSNKVLNYYKADRKAIKEGKWFYLRAPKIFLDVFLPKLDHKLKDLAEIRFGIKTGANEFFYMKDVSSLYEADYLTNPKKFQEWFKGIVDKIPTNKEELERLGLIYIENEGKERFVINKEDLKPLIRSPKEIQRYLIPEPTTLCLYTNNPGKLTKKYIKYGERKGFDKRPTCRSRNPWYKLPDFSNTKILLPMSWMDIIYIPKSKEPCICDHRLYSLYRKNNVNEDKLWLYLNSTLFYLTVELYCRRLGGGGGATDIMVEDYEVMPVPSSTIINRIDYDPEPLLNRKPLIYYKEVEQKDRRALDRAVLKALGFNEGEIDKLLDELYKAFIDVVDDRLIKADRPLKRLKENDNEHNR